MPVGLTVAGSDSSGGAGIVADAATFRALGVWPTVAITVVTAQHTAGVDRVEVLDPALVRAQIDAVASDMTIDAVKVGAVGSAAIATVVADAIRERGLPRPVVDPVLASSTGASLSAVAALDPLLPLAALVTPNLAEAAALAGRAVDDRGDAEEAGRLLLERGAGAVLVTGGHGRGDTVADCLVTAAGVRWFEAPRLTTDDLHGTGCVLSSAIAAHLALGLDLEGACAKGIEFVRRAITGSRRLGRGPGPVDPGLSWRA